MWQDGRCGNWDASTVADLVQVFEGGDPDEDIWRDMLRQAPAAAGAIVDGDSADAWDHLETWLYEKNYPPRDVATLKAILTAEKVLGGSAALKSALSTSRTRTSAKTDPWTGLF
jgi:hypothetical protein